MENDEPDEPDEPLDRDEEHYPNFICYECRAGDCDHCIGVPCMCTCPIPVKDPEYFL